MFPFLALTAAAGIGLCGGEAKAMLYPVYSRSAFGSTEFIDWASLGAAGTVVNNPFVVNTNLGTVVNGSMFAPGSLLRLNQDNPNAWQGNFNNGDALLFTDTIDDFSNPLTLSTTTGFAGAGTQIQADASGNFTARVSAFGAGNTLLDSFDFNGMSNFNPGEAIFIGVRSSTPSTPIFRVDFSLATAANSKSAFAIYQVDYTTAFDPPSPTDAAPAPLPIIGIGAGFAYSRKLKARIRASRQR